MFPVRLAASFAVSVALTAGSSVASAAPSPLPRTAFFYGERVPSELFAHYDRVVVEPGHVDAPPAPAPHAEVFAYVSVGELADSHPLHGAAKRSLFQARNPAWKADVADLANPEWHAFVLDRLVAPLWAKGFRGFFLDTLDSYELGAATPAARALQSNGLRALLAAMAARYPGVRLILNRGFDQIEAARANVAGLVAESLFAEWDPKAKAYGDVKKDDREWLLARLVEARDKWHVPVTVIDYVPRSALDKRREVAKKIVDLGFDAWVSTPELDQLGVGQIEVTPRHVLVLHDGDVRLSMSDAHVLAGSVLERLGYTVDYLATGDPLPAGQLSTRYAGVVTFLSATPARPAVLRQFLLDRVHEGVPIAVFGSFGFTPDAAFLRELGLSLSRGEESLLVGSAAPWTTFETKRIEVGRSMPPFEVTSPNVTSHLRLIDAAGAPGDAVVLGPWGGIAYAPYVLSGGEDEMRRWIVDPYTFLRRALREPVAPVPDVTTEVGRRILTAHIDGDGFASRAELPGTPYAGKVIHDAIIAKYRIPYTVSIIEGEIGPTGMRPKETPELERLAQETFRLANVELASHAFSHPFYWEKAEAHQPSEGKVAHLPIPGYVFDLKRDIAGSVKYINERLAPPDKKVKVFLWTGDCLPSGDAVATATAIGLFNVNGGGATQTVDHPSATQTKGIVLPFPNGALQVYAPVQNDNIYSNHWLGPYYGFRRVIETFKLTESPRRTTPLTIYYHYFSGTKAAGIKALVDVHEWALGQEPHPLFLSEYAARAEAFPRASVARRLDGGWEFAGLGPIRTLRVDGDMGHVDLERSQDVAGFRDLPQGRYVHVTSDRPVLVASKTAPRGPWLDSSNGAVVKWARRAATAGFPRVDLRLRGWVPLAFAVAAPGARACTLTRAGGSVTGAQKAGVFQFDLKSSDTGEATLACQ